MWTLQSHVDDFFSTPSWWCAEATCLRSNTFGKGLCSNSGLDPVPSSERGSPGVRLITSSQSVWRVRVSDAASWVAGNHLLQHMLQYRSHAEKQHAVAPPAVTLIPICLRLVSPEHERADGLDTAPLLYLLLLPLDSSLLHSSKTRLGLSGTCSQLIFPEFS